MAKITHKKIAGVQELAAFDPKVVPVFADMAHMRLKNREILMIHWLCDVPRADKSVLVEKARVVITLNHAEQLHNALGKIIQQSKNGPANKE